MLTYLLYYFTCSVFYVTFGVTRDSTLIHTQKVDAIEETARGVGEWTPDDVSWSFEQERFVTRRVIRGGYVGESIGGSVMSFILGLCIESFWGAIRMDHRSILTKRIRSGNN